jgi:CheY-like chemotaxis protein
MCVSARIKISLRFSLIAIPMSVLEATMAFKFPRVLCIDDDEDSRVMLVKLLGLELIQSKGVGTAAEALAVIKSERFDLYLTDVRLPDLDGFELCRRLRDLDPFTPILFFSGAAYPADKKKGFAAGANGYVVKPELDDLLSTIKQLVSFADLPVSREIPTSQEKTIPRLLPASLREPLYVG